MYGYCLPSASLSPFFVSFSGIYDFRSFVRVEISVQEMKEDGKAEDVMWGLLRFSRGASLNG